MLPFICLNPPWQAFVDMVIRDTDGLAGEFGFTSPSASLRSLSLSAASTIVYPASMKETEGSQSSICVKSRQHMAHRQTRPFCEKCPRCKPGRMGNELRYGPSLVFLLGGGGVLNQCRTLVARVSRRGKCSRGKGARVLLLKCICRTLGTFKTLQARTKVGCQIGCPGRL